MNRGDDVGFKWVIGQIFFAHVPSSNVGFRLMFI